MSFLGTKRKRDAAFVAFARAKRMKFSEEPEEKKALVIARKALRRVNTMRRAAEVKVHDLESTIVPALGGVVVHLSDIAQGDTLLTRDGNQVKAIFLEVSYLSRIDPIPVDSFLRMVIVRDNLQVESTSPIIIDVFQTASPLAFKQRALPKRFTKLWSESITLTQTGSNHSVYGFFRTKLNFNIRWTGVLGSTISRNGLYLMAITTNAATEEPLTIVNIRLHFTDA